MKKKPPELGTKLQKIMSVMRKGIPGSPLREGTKLKQLKRFLYQFESASECPQRCRFCRPLGTVDSAPA